ncbi:MAG: rhodanese-like domain-containing protein [Microcystaceae cyanobacterium]
MIFKIKSIQLLLSGLVLSLFLFIGLMGFEQKFVLAEISSGVQTIPLEITTLDLKTDVTDFLTAIPSGYYTVSSIDALKKALANPQTLLIDVREKSEYQSGHIPSAINIPLRKLSQNLDQIPRDRPVILSCSTGYRSAMGVMTLHLLGYENVKGFPPSFMGWKNAGEAIAKS